MTRKTQNFRHRKSGFILTTLTALGLAATATGAFAQSIYVSPSGNGAATVTAATDSFFLNESSTDTTSASAATSTPSSSVESAGSPSFVDQYLPVGMFVLGVALFDRSLSNGSSTSSSSTVSTPALALASSSPAVSSVSVTSHALVPHAAGSTGLVISQVYGGGGNVNSIYTNDFIELYNSGPGTVNLMGYSVQYGSGTGTGSFGVTALSTTSLTLNSGQFFLVKEGVGSGGTTSFTGDVTGTLQLSSSQGRVALVSNTTAITGTTAATAPGILDYVGYTTGAISTVNTYEGNGPAPYNSFAQNSTYRYNSTSGTIADTDNNNADFVVGMATPRNSTYSGSIVPPDPTPEPSEFIAMFIGAGALGLLVARRRIGIKTAV